MALSPQGKIVLIVCEADEKGKQIKRF